METNDSNTKLPGWLSEKEMQDRTGFKTTTLWKLRQEGKIVSAKVGKRVFYELDSFLRLLEENAL